MVWPFNRKKNTSDESVPPEVQDYYQAEHRDRTGKAWLLAVLTLIVTVAAVLALFFGGRWIYRALTDGEDNAATSQTEDASQDQENQSDATEGDDPAANGGESNSGDGDVATPNDDQEVDPGTTPAPGATPQPTPPEVPSTGQSDVEVLPSTGGMDN